MTDHFEEKARDWDVNDRVKQLSAAIGSALLEHVPLHARMRVMDFGAGTGLISAHVAARVARIVAVDTSEAMLEALAAKAELRGKVEAVCQDIIRQPLDARFDLIMSAMAMHHVPDTGALLRRFAEHLDPGGLVALADLDKEDGSFHPPETQGVFHHGFDRGELGALLASTGFEDIRFHTAHSVITEDGEYPVFLVVARKGDSS